MSESSSPKPLPVPLLILGKDEMNLVEFPIARLGRNDTRLTIQYEGQIVKDGRVLEQKWMVSGSAAFGLPTEFAERVLVSLMSLTARDGFTERKVPFTIYRVLKMLGLSHNQRNYQAVEHALQQLVGLTIYSEGAFYDKVNDKRVTSKKGFHILEEFWLKSHESDDGNSDNGNGEAEQVQGYVIWSERIWANFKAGYIKNLDTEFYYSLQNPIARRLYRFLDKRMHYQDEYQIDVFDLAARLGMSTYRYPSDVTHKMKPGFDELLERGYLESAEAVKVGKFTRMKFVRSDHAQPALDEEEATPQTLEMGEDIITDLATSAETLECLYTRYSTPETLRKAWKDILRDFEIALPWATYSMVVDTALVDIEDEEAVIAVDPRYQDWIESRLQKQILSKLKLHLGVQVTTIRLSPIVF
jgi:hypothetical protein